MPGSVGDADLLKNSTGAVIGLRVNGISVPFGPGVNGVTASRALVESDNGQIIECLSAGITLTVPSGLSSNWNCQVIPNGTTSIASSGGTLLNGATTTLTRATASNPLFAIVSRMSAKGSYVVTGS